MRAKIPAGVGFQPAFWMLPQTPYGSRGYSYGEIDVMEAWGTFPGIASPHLHYVSTPGTPMSGNYCLVPTSATAYHTYAVEWTSTRMTFTYDGRTCWSTGWKPIAGYQPAGSAAPAPFDQKFYLIVNLAMGGATTPTNRASVLTRFPATMSVDYIRAWK
jgi:beta-glucanase (GH16 family)